MSWRSWTWLTFGLVSMVLPASASAAVVEVERVEVTFPTPIRTVTVLFRADAGEANRVTVTRTGTRFTFQDAGASLRAGDECRQDGALVRCDVPDSPTAVVVLGDGDDTADASGLGQETRARLEGGPGSDVLVGAPLGGQLDGGSGDDRLTGGPGDDELFGDSFAAGDPEPGDDVLEGGAGDDLLAPFGGVDVVRAGAGDDRLDLHRSGRDRVAGCGAGSDAASGVGLGHRLEECERATPADAGALLLPARVRDGKAVVRFDCVAEDPATCRGRISAGGRAVAFSNRTGRPVTLRVPLTARGRRSSRLVFRLSGTARFRRCAECRTVEASLRGSVVVAR